MRIAFDLDAALRNRYSGFYTFASGLLHGMNSIDTRPEMILFYQKRFEGLATTLMKGLGSWAEAKPCIYKFRWLQTIWKFLPVPSLRSLVGDFELYHCFHHFMPPREKRPTLMTVHDLRRYIHPGLYPKSNLRPFEIAVKRARHFIAISEETKKDLCRIFDIEPDKIHVVHLACSLDIPQLSSRQLKEMRHALLAKYGLSFEKYLVSFSSKDRRKNVERTIEAFHAALPELPRDTGLVILGRLPSSFSVRSRHVFTPGPVDDIISWLICANGLIFVSLYEGFGLPILEGFKAGIPVVTSNCSSMPEVAGGAAVLVDPYDIRKIREAIKTIILDDHMVQDLVSRGKKRLRDFSWEKTAAKTVEVYKRLL